MIVLISACRSGDHVLFKNEIAETIDSEYADLLWYCATRTDDKGSTYLLDSNFAHYDNNHDAMIVFHKDAPENLTAVSVNEIAEEIIEDLPSVIETSTLKMDVESLARERGLSPELFLLAAMKQYKEAGICSYKGMEGDNWMDIRSDRQKGMSY
ncbi:hypothetical protein, partial [Oscillibacter sp.]|uniref:hypothetical protein n=1 Tax=Oscillibacter sp. TaxID=1945593 RepID=UPI002898BE7E